MKEWSFALFGWMLIFGFGIAVFSVWSAVFSLFLK